MIDKTTGLPALPEGYRWFLEKDKPRHRTNTPAYNLIIQQWKTQHPHTTSEFKRTWRSFWFNYETVYTAGRKDMWVNIEQDYLFDFDDKMIVETAENILARFNREAYIKSRLGAYPPNSIPMRGGK